MINNDKLDIILYNIFNNDYSDEVKKVQLQKLINNINVDFDDLKNRYEWLKTMDIDPNIYHLEESGDSIVREWTQNLVLNEYVDFLGTDMHELDFRPPSVEQGLAWLRENCSEQYFEFLTQSNAAEKLLLGNTK